MLTPDAITSTPLTDAHVARLFNLATTLLMAYQADPATAKVDHGETVSALYFPAFYATTVGLKDIQDMDRVAARIVAIQGVLNAISAIEAA